MDDSIEGIIDSYRQCMHISKWAGGIGLNITNIRSNGIMIKGTNGLSQGIIPLCKTLNEIAKHINQGGKRKGSIAVYIEPHHPDILEFLELRLPIGSDESRARDLFLALWISDLFMKRMKTPDSMWSLFDPHLCPELYSTFGDEFEKYYLQFESEKKYSKQVKTIEIWNKIVKSLIEAGLPYIMYKDSVNRKNNQKNLGLIKSSNLCVIGSTPLLTSMGYFRIKDLSGQKIKVWNGETFTESLVCMTGKDKKIVKLIFNNSMEIECTEQHKFHTKNGIKAAKDLTTKDFIIDYNLPILDFIENPQNIDYTIQFNQMILKKDYTNLFNLIPLNCSLKTKNKWFFILFNLLNITYIDNNNVLRINTEYYQKLILLLSTCGILVKTVKDNSVYLDNENITLLQKQNVKIILDKFIKEDTIYEFNKHLQLTYVIDENIYQDTYCLREKQYGRILLNTILTGNCTEIVEYTSKDEVAVCNLASIALSKFVIKNVPMENTNDFSKVFNFNKLIEVTKRCVRNLNRVIDITFYPVEEAKNSNMKHRPIAIGVQGWQDTLFLLKMPFESTEANELNKQIFETIYYAALRESCDIAMKDGHYKSFQGSYFSEGKLQFDLWDVQPTMNYNWKQLKEDIMKYGTRNSLLTSLMPTVSTSQILGNYESFEPVTNNFFTRKTLAGKFYIINKYLVDDLIKLRLWNDSIRNAIILNNGSIQGINKIPQYIKTLYKTNWEIKQKAVIDQSLTRAPFIDQAQSLNIYYDKNKLTNSEYIKNINSFLFYTWKKGSKNGVYYFRSQPAAEPIKISVDQSNVIEEDPDNLDNLDNENLDNENLDEEVCESCSG